MGVEDKCMKRKILSICCVLCMVLSLAACQETPEEEIVLDKSKGLPKDSILPKESQIPKDFGAPDQWQESVEKGNIAVSIKADCQINLPQIYNAPVYELEVQHMTGELLEQLCEYFSDGNPLYKEPEMSKARLEEEKEILQQGKGEWGFDDQEIIDAKTDQIDELLQDAPPKESKESVEVKLDKPRQTEYERIQTKSGSIAPRYSKFYFDTDEKIGFRARVDCGKKTDPLIYAIDYDEDVGSTTNFLFQQGNFIDEKELAKKLKNCELLQIGQNYLEYLQWIETEMNDTDRFTISEEEAVAMCGKVLEDLGLNDYTMTGCCRTVGTAEGESMAGVNQDEGITDYGFSIYYNRKAGELAGYEQPFQQPFNDLPEEVYAPPFATEQIRIIVTGEGIMQFEWDNLSQKAGTIAENTELLSFDEIKEKLYDHLLYVSLAKYGEEDYGDIYYYEIRDVQLRGANVPAFENPDGAWLVPVWVFTVGHEVTFGTLGTTPFSDMIVVLNAIDGGYIQPNIDSRIPVD